MKLFSPKGRVREQCSCGKPQVAFENRDPALDKLNKSHQSTNCYKTNTESKKEQNLIMTNLQLSQTLDKQHWVGETGNKIGLWSEGDSLVGQLNSYKI